MCDKVTFFPMDASHLHEQQPQNAYSLDNYAFLHDLSILTNVFYFNKIPTTLSFHRLWYKY